MKQIKEKKRISKRKVVQLVSVTLSLIALLGLFVLQIIDLHLDIDHLEMNLEYLESDLVDMREEITLLKETDIYTFENFSIRYPHAWTLKDMREGDDILLADQLAEYCEDEDENIISLSKDDLTMMITIENDTESVISGVFLTDEEEEESRAYTTDFEIDGEEYGLAKVFIFTQEELLGFERTPDMWSRVYQYAEEDGQKGYNGEIKMDGYTYNIIFIGEGDTAKLEQEMLGEVLDILETIDW
jgi:hypothetical protein